MLIRPRPSAPHAASPSRYLQGARGLWAGLLATVGHAAERYADRPEAQQFIDEMQQKHGFDKDALTYIFRRAEYLPSVIKYISPPKDPTGVRSWQRYRSRFVEPVRIKAGVAFWDRYQDAIRAASAAKASSCSSRAKRSLSSMDRCGEFVMV